jgi:hypothetical protein
MPIIASRYQAPGALPNGRKSSSPWMSLATGTSAATDKSSPKKVAVKSFVLQKGVRPLSSAPVWAEPSQLLFGMWLWEQTGRIPTLR